MKINLPFRRRKKSENGEMPLSGHLRELRNRIAVCVILLILAMLVCLNFAPRLINFLLDIGRQYQYRFVYIAPQELLLQYFGISLTAALCITMPMILYQIWAFIRPGLRKNENIFFMLAMIMGLICFCAGIFFAYQVMLPFMLRFLIGLGRTSLASAAISVQNYIGFLTTIFLIFGIVFELPVVSLILTQLGFLSPGLMRKIRKVVIVASFLIAAFITPPDVVSQVMVALPMIALYELSIGLCSISIKLKRNKNRNI